MTELGTEIASYGEASLLKICEEDEKCPTLLTSTEDERSKDRKSTQTQYKSLDKSTVFCDIIVQVLLDLQFVREKYEDGILILHDVNNSNLLPEKEKMEGGMKELFEGLKKHMQLQDYLFAKYEYFVEPNGKKEEIIEDANCKEEKISGPEFLTVKMEEEGLGSSNTPSLLPALSPDPDDILPDLSDLPDLPDPQDFDEEIIDAKPVATVKNEAIKVETSKKKFECEFCLKMFTAKKHLTAHRRIHTGDAPYSCDACDKTFKQIASLNIHKRSHTGLKPFNCDQCSKQYGTSAELKAHQRIHTGEKPYKCSECPKAFALPTSLKHHKMTHTGEKPFKCDQCGHGFIHKGQLNTHMRSHTGEKPFKCDQCGRGFTRGFDLGTHMRTHTGERPYKCPYCSNAFAKKHTLDNHIRIHTGEKPFKCEFCEKEFRQQGDMAKHRKKKHNIQLELV
eukprot:TRINITY_DN8266_c0_g1_i4.p1 TRINITY_DN8266_c0_g1~~TRINITY_DN8266_c0_g1_i4.p1  ORF type:complete len:450 (-),score=56.72 TRINITY_DN8266_c0_g1_i4:294-1643(-)